MHAIQAALHDWVAISVSLLKINCMAAGQQSHESNQIKLMGLKEEKDSH